MKDASPPVPRRRTAEEWATEWCKLRCLVYKNCPARFRFGVKCGTRPDALKLISRILRSERREKGGHHEASANES